MRQILDHKDKNDMNALTIFSHEYDLESDRELLNSIDGFSMVDIDKNIQAHLSGREDNSALIYALISFQEWYKMYIN